MGWGCCSPGITKGDLKSAMEYIGALCLCNVSLSAPPDTRWDNVTGSARGAKRTLHEAIVWLHMQRRAFEVLGGCNPPGGCCSTARQGVQRGCC
jgi:hypothetical protein